MSLHTRFVLLFASLSALIILLLSGFVWYFAHEFAFGDFYKRLEARVNITARAKVFRDENSAEFAEVRGLYLERLSAEQEYIAAADPAALEALKRKLPLSADFYAQADKGEWARFRQGNTFYAGRHFRTGGQGHIVIISAKDPYGYSELKYLQRILVAGFFLATALSYLVGRRFSDYMFRPVKALIRKTRGINVENLHQRLDMVSGTDEIAEITQTFNDMLDRLETAFETQNNFISNASHELRTPLTIISGEAELALSGKDAGSGPDVRALRRIQLEAERLENILTSLLNLAQTGFDGQKQRWEKIRLDELLWDVKTAADLINPENEVEIDFSMLPEDAEEISVYGNLNLLKLAISNIVNNACKYSDNRKVSVALSIAAGSAVVAVKDQGIGIPADELQHVFEPFFRASNTVNYNGYGVGLPLALNIIRLHRGSIEIKTEQASGTEINVLLPVRQS